MSPIYVGNRRIIGTQSSDPTGLGVNDEGSVYYNSTDDKLRAWDGSAWDDVSGAAAFAGTDATHWWKNEGITQSTWTAERGNVNFTEQNGSLTYTANDSRFGNLKSIGNTANTYTYMTADTNSNGSFWNASQAFSFIAVIDKDAQVTSNYGDACFIHQWNGQPDGSWSLDLTGDHTWGGGYGEIIGKINAPGSFPQKGILMFRAGSGGSSGQLQWCAAGQSSWSTQASTSGWPSNISNSYDAINLFNFTGASHSGHRFSGYYAEVAYFKDLSISDTTRDAWKDYLKAKFSI